jgi:putative transcriptional regulator
LVTFKQTLRHFAKLLGFSLFFTTFVATPGIARDLSAGTLLVANQNLRDANFAESVVLLLRYGDSGAMGVIINRSTGRQFSRPIQNQDSVAQWDIPLYDGGPVSHQRVSLLFQSSVPIQGANPILERTYFTMDPAVLESLMARRDEITNIRAYSGHAGWATGQLEREVARGGWQVVEGDASLVFSSSPAEVWLNLVRRTNTKLAMRQPARESGRPAKINLAPRFLSGR